jgi:hypothetical protein
VIEPPKIRGNKILEAITDGWQISGITQIESGAQLTNQSGSTGLAFNYGRDNLTDADNNVLARYDNIHMLGTPDVQLYPLLTCNPAKGVQKGQYMNPDCFAPAPEGTLGSTHAPYLPGPKFWNSDLSLQRTIRITERQAVEFRVSAFNFLNHALDSFTSGDNNLKVTFNADGTIKNADTLGKPSARYGHRTMEFGVKYTF